MFNGSSCRTFPEVPVARRATLRAFLVGLMGRSSRPKVIQKKGFFSIGSFGLFLVFFLLFLAIHFAVLVSFTVLRTPCDTRHPPPILLHTPLAPIPHYTFPPPVPLTPILNLSKTSSCTLEFSLFFFPQALLRRV